MDVAATEAVAPVRREGGRKGIVAPAPRAEGESSARWPGWARIALLFGGSVLLWGAVIAGAVLILSR